MDKVKTFSGSAIISGPGKNQMQQISHHRHRRSYFHRSHRLARVCSFSLLLSVLSDHLDAFSPRKLHQRSLTLMSPSKPPISSVGYGGILQKRNPSPPRSAVIQPYRIDDDYSSSPDPVVSQPKQSDVFSFLPSRISSIQRLETPSQFQSKVLDENDSLVVVRFYADACPSCRVTGPMFRKWSRDHSEQHGSRSTASIKFLEMPLTKATSDFFQHNLEVDKLPTYRLYHPRLGLVEENVVIKKSEFNYFVDKVDGWANDDVDTRDMTPSRRRTVSVNHVVEVDYESKREIEYGTGSEFQ